MPATRDYTEVAVTVTSIKFSKQSQYDDSKHWYVLFTDQGYMLTGEAESGTILSGCKYRCSGFFDEYQGKKQFKFGSIAMLEPATRSGVTGYLAKHAPWIGQTIASKLCTKFGVNDCIAILKEDPQRVADSGIGLNLERCQEASKALKAIEKYESTRIELEELLRNRGFRKALPDQLIKDFGVAAATTVKTNPFILLEKNYAGCGYLLVNDLYISLGHDPAAIIRQIHALVYVLGDLADSSTWGRRSDVYSTVAKLIGNGLRFPEAISEALQQNKIKVRTDRGGEMWLACKEYADQEALIAEMLWEIGGEGLLGDVGEKAGQARFAEDFGENPLDGLLEAEPRQDVRDIAAPLRTLPARPVAKPKPHPRSPASASAEIDEDDLSFEIDATDEAYETAKELIEELDDAIEQLESIEAADNFRESITESLCGISEYIERRKTATEKQINALRSMISGAERWLERVE